MNLSSIEQIKEKESGITVFMPKGVQATLKMDGENVVVEYADFSKQTYTQDEFKPILDSGLFIFNDRPTTQVIEALESEKTLESFLGIQEDKFIKIDDLINYIEDNTNYAVVGYGDYWIKIIDKEENEGEEIMINLNKKFKEAYDQDDNKAGAIFKAMKDEKRKEYLTPEYKLMIEDKLNTIARKYPDAKVRQQATTFLDEIGVGKYYDMGKVKKFIDDNIDVLTANELDFQPVTESVEQDAKVIVDELLTGKKEGFDNKVFGNWKVTTSLDNSWFNLTEPVQNFILKAISEEIVKGNLNFNDLEIVITKDSNLSTDDIKSLGMFSDEEIDKVLKENEKLNAYISFEVEHDDKLEEAFKVKKQKCNKKKLDELTESKYVVYTNIDDRESQSFGSWNEVEDYLNKEWDAHLSTNVKENPEYGTEDDKEAFLGGFEVSLEQAQPVEEIKPRDEKGIEINCEDDECIDDLIDELCMCDIDCLEEDFKDNMGMLTDINDLDFPDALQNAVDTKEDGSLYRIADIAKLVQELKGELETLKTDIKTALGELKQDIKSDVKDIQTDVTSKLDNTQTAISNLTSEEEDIELEDEELQDEVEGELADEQEQEEQPEENMEESYDNAIFKTVQRAVKSLKGEQVTMDEFYQILGSDYKVNTKSGAIAGAISNIVNEHFASSIKSSNMSESFYGTIRKFTRDGYMNRLASVKKEDQIRNAFLREDINQAKQEIDRVKDQGSEKVKSAIALTTDSEEEKKQATEYAIDKMSETKANSLKESLLNTSKSAKLSNLQ